MKRIHAYKTMAGALRALDNGGRLWNVFARAGDGVVTPSELARAAGTLSVNNDAILYFFLALARLDAESRRAIVSKLAEPLERRLAGRYPKQLAVEPGAADALGVVEGYAVKLEASSGFDGQFHLLPDDPPGSTRLYEEAAARVLAPLMDFREVWRVYEQPSLQGRSFVVASIKVRHLVSSQRMAFGGVLHPLHFKSQPDVTTYFLDAKCYCRL